MDAELKLMAVLAHPDDESLGMGGTLARYAADGVETFVVSATRGERGWTGAAEENPGLEALGRRREAELRAAARVLGVREVAFLDYCDGDLDQAAPAEAIARIVRHLRRVRPQVVVTFSPDGHYGHPDHIAISQLTHAAVVAAADGAVADPDHQASHRVGKLYYVVDSTSVVAQVQALVGGISMTVDGIERRHVGWEEWAITTRIDATAHWRTAWQAILCHESQLPSLGPIADLPEDTIRQLWGHGTFYRAFSLVNGGRQTEHDLFAGLR